MGVCTTVAWHKLFQVRQKSYTDLPKRHGVRAKNLNPDHRRAQYKRSAFSARSFRFKYVRHHIPGGLPGNGSNSDGLPPSLTRMLWAFEMPQNFVRSFRVL